MGKRSEIRTIGSTQAKDVEPVLRRARKQGWKVERTGGGHLVWTSPLGQVVRTPMSPRSPSGMLRRLREAGLK